MTDDAAKKSLLSAEGKVEFQKLFSEFVEQYLKQAKGQKHVELALRGREQAKMNFELVEQALQKGQDITDLVLEKLLPHQNTSHNRGRNAWIHVAPAITKDIKSWYEAAGNVSEGDWPEVARGVFEFISGSLKSPENLQEYCDSLNSNPKIKGFQSGFLSPILNALNPKDFILINNKSYRMINHFSGTRFTTKLEDYPKINEKGLQFLAEVGQIVEPVTPSGLPACEILDMFSHWLKAEKKYWDEATPVANTEGVRYWQIAPGENARFWEEFKRDSIAGVGFTEIDMDLTGITADGLMRLLEERYPSFSEQKRKVNFSQLWSFINLKPGDRIVTNRGRSKLLAVGAVTGEYKFRPERSEYKHTVNVIYDRIPNGGIDIPDHLKGKFGRTILELSKSEFEELEALFGGKPEGQNHWWLNANPRIWNFVETAVGAREIYTSFNEKGNKRRVYKYFTEVKPGDYIVGYVASPVREVVALCKATEGLHDTEFGEGFEFEKVEQFQVPVPFDELKQAPDLKNCEPLMNHQGSLFRLTKEEFETIRAIIDAKNEGEDVVSGISAYTFDDAFRDLFLEREVFQSIVDRLKLKKNVILQGPPGVGKTFLARRLAYCVMGSKDDRRVAMIQFHQSYSYEDFIQGFRPNREGHFDLKNGIFYEFCRKAQRDPTSDYFFIIDEINRGNLSKIFGEMLMLIEADKRGPDFAMPLTYARGPEDTFFVPANLHIIGTMNTADRSLAMVDYALRRRFCFIDLQPMFESEKFKSHLVGCNVALEMIERLIDRMRRLNEIIAGDTRNLGRGYRIGHSYFCPIDSSGGYDESWYGTVVLTEIEPLLKEYWFDDPDKVKKQVEHLLS